MTERRFRWDWKTGRWKDTQSNWLATKDPRGLESIINLACLGYEKEINKLKKENERLKQENSVFKGKDIEHYQRWANQIKKYVEEDNPYFTYDDDFIIKIALSYTLQSLRHGEDLKRFQWNYKELEE